MVVPFYNGGAAISGSASVGSTLSATAGSWTNYPGCTNITFQYRWLSDGNAIAGQTGSAYVVQTGDQTHGISANVQGCNNLDCSGWVSTNTISIPPPPPPPNRSPVTPFEDVAPADGAVADGVGSEPMYMKYSDPDGDNGYITYTIRNASGTTVEQFNGGTVASGADSIAYTQTGLASGYYTWSAVATDSHGASSGASATHSLWVDVAPAVPTLATPSTGATLPTLSPVLTATSSDPEGETIGYMFRVTSDSGCTSAVSTSDWLPNTTSYTVPSSALLDGSTYYWCVRARDWAGRTPGYDSNYASAWSSVRSFTVQLPRMGTRNYWPMWSDGALAMNESTGNLVVSAPGPSIPTAAGDLGIGFTFNSLDKRASALPTANNFGSWTMSDDAGTPARLIDHSHLTGNDGFDAVELVSGDGSSDWFGHVSGSAAYTSSAGDPTTLIGLSGGGFEVTTGGGSIYTYGSADPTTGVAPPQSAETYSANGQAHIDYTFSAGKLSSITAYGKNGAGTDQQLAQLTFNWSCSGALLCVTTPDGPSYIWKYVGTSGSTGALASVSDGVRTVLQLTYDSAGRPSLLQNADDLDPTHASPGYLTGHGIALTYDASNRLATVTSSTRNRFYAPTTLNSRWTFSYATAGASCPGLSLANAAATHAFTRLATGGCTDITPPNQDSAPAPAKVHVFYDVLGQPLERVDPLGNYTLEAYDRRNQLEWTEDQLGAPTDYSYDPFTYNLSSVTGTDPDGSGPLPAPVTSYRYDETNVGTATTSGPALQGLQAAYFTNANLSGFPAVIQNDANIDSTASWTGGAPPALGGQSTNFSVRWTGTINIAADGTYVLATLADGGSRVTVDNPVGTSGSAYESISAVDRWSGQTTAAPQCSLPVTLQHGLHHIAVDYHETTGAATIKLELGTSCAALATVASSQLTPGWSNRTSTVAPADSIGGSARVVFEHIANPAIRVPDYSLATVSGTGLVTSFTYDSFGRVTSKTLPKGNVGRMQGDGSLTGTGDPKYTTTYSYYPAGQTASPPPSCGGTAVNQMGLPASVATYGLATKTTVYDVLGDPVAFTDGAGTTCSTYDHEGRVTSDKAPGEATATMYAYDPAGLLLSQTNATGTDSYVYNEHGALVDTADTFGAEAENVLDADGNVTSRRVSTTALATGPVYATSYAFDADDRETSLTDSSARTWSFYYDRRGAPTGTQNPNGTFSWNSYLANGWLSATYNRHGTINGSTTSPPADAVPISDFDYTYNPDGSRGQETRRTGQPGTGALTVSGNEITDAGRTAANQGDGRTAPDSSFGVWQPATNLIPNGGIENGASGWSAISGASITADSTIAKFGGQSLKVTATAAGQGAGVSAVVNASMTYSFSAWVYCNSTCATAATHVQPQWAEYASGTLNNTKTGTIQTLTSGWNRLAFSATTAAGINTVTASVKETSSAATIYLDGAQLEVGNVSTPYVNSNAAGKNVVSNGGFEFDASGWSAVGGGTISQDTGTAKFGAHSLKVVAVATQGALINVPASASTAYTFSFYLYCNAACVTAGTHVTPQWDENVGTAYNNTKTGTTSALAAGWTRLSMSATTAASITSINVYFKITSGPATLWLDGVQVETGSTATTYADTNGTSASRSAARVQASSTGLSATQGWIALRFRTGWGTSSPPGAPSAYPALFDWRADENNRVSAYFVPGSNAFVLERRTNVGSDTVGSAATTFASGTAITVVVAWTATTLSVSVNGAAFVTAASTRIPTSLPSLFDLAQIAGGNSFLNSDVLWAAAGSGTVTNTDVSTLNAFGNADPNLASTPCAPVFVWSADTTGDATSLTLETMSYTYDSLGRLSHVTFPNGTGRDYAYDGDSNRTSVTDNGSQTTSYTYNATTSPGVDELTSTLTAGTTTAYSYSSDGEVTARGGDTITWDGRGRTTGGTFAGTTLTDTYDPAGFVRQRAAGANTKSYLLRGQIQTTSGQITLFSIDGPMGPVAHYDGPPTTATPTYLYYDAHGDLAAQLSGTNTTPTASDTFHYDAFGAPAPAPTGTTTVTRYLAQYDKNLDPTSGLIEMGARPYDPNLGRFLTVDPIDGGSLNNYDYAGQDPVDGYDLDGTMLQASPAEAGKITVEMATVILNAIGAAGVRASKLGSALRNALDAGERSAAARALPGAGRLAKQIGLPEWLDRSAGGGLFVAGFALDVATGDSVKRAAGAAIGGAIGAMAGRMIGGAACGAAGVATAGSGLALCGAAIVGGSLVFGYVGSKIGVFVAMKL
jgi:RHS repeat-associated protein